MFFINKDFKSPSSWCFALLIGVLWCLTRFPYRTQLRHADKLGRFIYFASKKVKHVIQSNIRACFPQLTEDEVQLMAKHSAEELGVSITETFIIWFRDNNKFLASRMQVIGEENLEKALEHDKGIILLSCHYGSVDLNGALISRLNRGGRKFIGTFRQTRPFVNRFLHSARSKYVDELLPSNDQRNVVKALKAGEIVWYAPDIEVNNKSSAFVDFMGVKASTTLAISRLAKLTGAIVVPIGHYRLNDKPEYQLTILPPLDNFPSDDPAQDARQMNLVMEKILAPHPERYWWVIKRFKHRPEGEAAIY